MSRWPLYLLCAMLLAAPAARADEAVGSLLAPQTTNNDPVGASLPQPIAPLPEPTASVDYVDLSRSDKGEAVMQLQQRLCELGYYSGQIHGKYDTATQKAMKMFEKSNGLRNDGNASVADQEALYSAEALSIAGTPLSQSAGTPDASVDPAFADYVPLDYARFVASPQDYAEINAVVTGRVAQVGWDSRGGYGVRVDTADGYVYVRLPDEEIPSVNQNLTLYVVLKGTESYESVLGSTVMIPSAQAVYVIPR